VGQAAGILGAQGQPQIISGAKHGGREVVGGQAGQQAAVRCMAGQDGAAFQQALVHDQQPVGVDRDRRRVLRPGGEGRSRPAGDVDPGQGVAGEVADDHAAAIPGDAPQQAVGAA